MKKRDMSWSRKAACRNFQILLMYCLFANGRATMYIYLSQTPEFFFVTRIKIPLL